MALGGHRLLVPHVQHYEASVILLEVLGDDEWSFSCGLRGAVLRLAALWCSVNFASLMLAVLAGAPISILVGAPISVLAMPVNPQGRGDYYLHERALLED